jgi:hypothetical protein
MSPSNAFALQTQSLHIGEVDCLAVVCGSCSSWFKVSLVQACVHIGHDFFIIQSVSVLTDTAQDGK